MDTAFESVSLEAGVRVARGYRGHCGGHGIVAAEHALALMYRVAAESAQSPRWASLSLAIGSKTALSRRREASGTHG
jgi:hypothetical protein